MIQSPYRIGAERGLAFGMILCTMFFAYVYSTQVPFLSLVALGLFIFVPFWIYHRLRRTFVAESYATTLSGLWMQGIVIFACGSAICAAASIVYMKWIEPDFIINAVRQAISFYENSPTPRAAEVADILQRMIEIHAVPTPAAVAIEMLWLSIFSGSILSLLMALLARARGKGSTNRR